MKHKIKRSKTDKNPIVVDYDFGEDLEEAQRMFDGDSPLEKVVYGLYLIAARQQLSDFVRKQAKGNTVETIQVRLRSWKPSVEKRAQLNVKRAAKVLEGLSPEEREVLFRNHAV